MLWLFAALYGSTMCHSTIAGIHVHDLEAKPGLAPQAAAWHAQNGRHDVYRFSKHCKQEKQALTRTKTAQPSYSNKARACYVNEGSVTPPRLKAGMMKAARTASYRRWWKTTLPPDLEILLLVARRYYHLKREFWMHALQLPRKGVACWHLASSVALWLQSTLSQRSVNATVNATVNARWCVQKHTILHKPAIYI
jgi:hypothetical protein